MEILKIINFIIKSENEHFLSVDYKFYKKWKYLIKISILLNNNYKPCEIYRKKFKSLKNLVVIGLKYSGKKVKRRTSGYAKDFIDKNENTTCLYCGVNLDYNNATADHIIPISNGGNNTQVNLIVCCKNCNGERGNMEFKKFLSTKNLKYKKIKFI